MTFEWYLSECAKIDSNPKMLALANNINRRPGNYWTKVYYGENMQSAAVSEVRVRFEFAINHSDFDCGLARSASDNPTVWSDSIHYAHWTSLRRGNIFIADPLCYCFHQISDTQMFLRTQNLVYDVACTYYTMAKHSGTIPTHNPSCSVRII